MIHPLLKPSEVPLGATVRFIQVSGEKPAHDDEGPLEAFRCLVGFGHRKKFVAAFDESDIGSDGGLRVLGFGEENVRPDVRFTPLHLYSFVEHAPVETEFAIIGPDKALRHCDVFGGGRDDHLRVYKAPDGHIYYCDPGTTPEYGCRADLPESHFLTPVTTIGRGKAPARMRCAA